MAKSMLDTFTNLPHRRAWAGQGVSSMPGAAGEKREALLDDFRSLLSSSPPPIRPPTHTCPFSGAVSGKFAIRGAGHGYKQLVGCMGLTSTPGIAPDCVACRRGLEESLVKPFQEEGQGRRAHTGNTTATGYWNRLLKTHFLFYKVK